MVTLKVDEFVRLVERSGLVDRDTLTQAVADLRPEPHDSGVVCSTLQQAGLLTGWQCEQLMEGRHRGFFLGKYKLLEQLGSGGMGSVYLAEHAVMHRQVAIKVLPPERAKDPDYLERFHQEARAVAAMDDPNVVRAFDVDHADGYHFLVMEYVPGRDIQRMVQDDGPLPFRVAAEYAAQATKGLSHAHQMGLIHRDVKPANLLVDLSGTVKLLDLGLAHFTDHRQAALSDAQKQQIVGTVDYLAPEQVQDSHAVDERADVYSLGCTLYFMLTGRPPFPQGTPAERMARHLRAVPKEVAQLRPGAPPGLIAICRRMMRKRPGERYPSMLAVAKALRGWLDGASINAQGDIVTPDELTVEELTQVSDERPEAVRRPNRRPSQPAAAAATPRTPTPARRRTKADDQLLVADLSALDSRVSRRLPGNPATGDHQSAAGSSSSAGARWAAVAIVGVLVVLLLVILAALALVT